MNVQIEQSWKAVLSTEFDKPYFARLAESVRSEYRSGVCYPPARLVFNAFNLCPFDSVRVVIIGQDPYHEPNQAHGLSFSVNPGIDIPPSLVNIYKELHDDIGFTIPQSGCLVKWAEQGVMLLNTVLTVRAHLANSHQGKGWEQFTDATIAALNKQDRPIVYMLWGRPARQKAAMLNNPGHLVLEAAHPSPLSAYKGFFGCRHFSKANDFLAANGESPIDWQLL